MSQLARMSAEEREAVFTETGVRQGIHPFHIEKDYWVCWTLSQLFTSNDIAPHLVFRGGTSLSKAWGCIRRFSEDIDLAMSRNWRMSGAPIEAPDPDASSSAQERHLKQLRRQCREVIEQAIAPYLIERMGQIAEDADERIVMEDLKKARDPFVILVRYPATKLLPPSDYFKPQVKIELSGRAEGMPAAVRTVEPYVTQEFPGVEPPGRQYEIRSVRPVRTFWEKLALIHEHNVRPERKAPGERYSRHFYDLHQLWNEEKIGATLEEHLPVFDTVMQHRASAFSYNWVDHRSLKPGELVLHPPEEEVAAWRNDYRKMESMFFGEALSFSELLATLQHIEAALNN